MQNDSPKRAAQGRYDFKGAEYLLELVVVAGKTVLTTAVEKRPLEDGQGKTRPVGRRILTSVRLKSGKREGMADQ